MNIQIPKSWIDRFIRTPYEPRAMAADLSLHSFSIEKTTPTKDGDFVFEVEVTPNRSDALSVLGIAREVKVLCEIQGKKYDWLGFESSPFNDKGEFDISVEIADPTLVPRFTAVVLRNFKVGPTPAVWASLLEKSGIRSINNIVDVTNIAMVALGQPMHAFDYDKILGQKMIVRESKSGEEITTLDGVARKLPQGVIVIEDGSGRLIDLCGIMGAENSEVTEATQNVLLFVQAYDPVRIRKASMSLGHRTDAALRFEKGIDLLGIIPSLNYSVNLLQEIAPGFTASKVFDKLFVSDSAVKIPYDLDFVNKYAGVKIDPTFAKTVLTSLGFKFEDEKTLLVPSYRKGEVEIPADISEELIRFYGYKNVPSVLPTGRARIVTHQAPEDSPFTFAQEDALRDLLKDLGFFELYHYTLIPSSGAPESSVRLSNPLSEDFAYLRESLAPQVVKTLKQNRQSGQKLKVFELGHVYGKPQNINKLPASEYRLIMASCGLDFLEFKGYLESALACLGVQLDSAYLQIKEHENGILVYEESFEKISSTGQHLSASYTPSPTFTPVIEDFTFVLGYGIKHTYSELVAKLKSVDERIGKVSLLGTYQDSISISVYYQSEEKQLSGDDAKEIRKKITLWAEKEGITLKGAL